MRVPLPLPGGYVLHADITPSVAPCVSLGEAPSDALICKHCGVALGYRDLNYTAPGARLCKKCNRADRDAKLAGRYIQPTPTVRIRHRWR